MARTLIERETAGEILPRTAQVPAAGAGSPPARRSFALVQVRRRLPAVPDKAPEGPAALAAGEAYHVTARWGNFTFFSAWITAADPDEAMAIAVARLRSSGSLRGRETPPATPGVALWIAAAVLTLAVLAALIVLPT